MHIELNQPTALYIGRRNRNPFHYISVLRIDWVKIIVHGFSIVLESIYLHSDIPKIGFTIPFNIL